MSAEDLEAEINNFDVPIFDDSLVNNRPELVNKSLELFVIRKNKLGLGLQLMPGLPEDDEVKFL